MIRRLNLAGIAMALHSRNHHPTSSSLSAPLNWVGRHPYMAGVAAVAAALTVSGVTNHLLARRAEQRNPPSGHFVDSNGVRLHYIDRGNGPPLVLLHGNGSMIDDFETSGLIDLAARHHRVIVFDRPGYGHSTRPRSRIWSAQAQAKLIHDALDRIGVSRAVVLGHSWGTSVAVALALKYPHSVNGLVLASGYFYPTARVDMLFIAGPAVPILGDLARYTVAPIVSRLIWPLLMRKIFGPAPVPTKFRGFPKEMAVRPSQIRAEAAESALLIPAAAAMSGRYSELKMPVVIVAGAEDRLIDPDKQSARLHNEVPASRLRLLASAGHMVHQTETVAVMAAIDEVFLMSSPPSGVDVASPPLEPRRGSSAAEFGPRPQHAK